MGYEIFLDPGCTFSVEKKTPKERTFGSLAVCGLPATGRSMALRTRGKTGQPFRVFLQTNLLEELIQIVICKNSFTCRLIIARKVHIFH